jgi:hypothetical protein
MANYSFLFSTFINQNYNPKNVKNFFEKLKLIFVVFYLILS